MSVTIAGLVVVSSSVEGAAVVVSASALEASFKVVASVVIVDET